MASKNELKDLQKKSEEEKIIYNLELKALKIILEAKTKGIRNLENQVNGGKILLAKTIKEVQLLKLQAGEHEKKEIELREEHERFVDLLKDKLECPVCMDIPRKGPISICSNGHYVCRTCKRDLCPTCRVVMGENKSLLAVAVIENIDHKCKFDDCGEFFSVDKVEDHEKSCDHRIVDCPKSNCQEKLALSKLINHLNVANCSSDSVPEIIEDFSELRKLNYKTIGGSAIVYPLKTFSYQGVNFCVFPELSGGIFHFSLVMFESEEECSKYKIEIIIHERYSASVDDSGLSFKFCGKPSSIDSDKEELKYHGLAVYEKGLKQIVNKSCNREFTLSFKIIKNC